MIDSGVEEGLVAPLIQRGWLATGIALLALIIWGSLTPTPPHIELPVPQFDKIEHLGAYLLITAWFVAAYPKHWLWVALGAVLLGGAIEIAQSYTGRDPDWFDWLADCFGAALGAWYPARWALRVRLALAATYAHQHT